MRRSNFAVGGTSILPTPLTIRIAAGILGILAWIQTATYLWKSFEWAHGDFGHGLAIFFGYYTNWVMLLSGAVWLLIAFRKAERQAPWLITLALVANITMLLGYWTAVTWTQYRSNPFYHQAAHGPIPLALVLFWLTCIRHGELRYRDALIWPIVPLAYTAWMLLYGYLTDYYPYWQLDPSRVGWRRICTNIAMISVATFVGGLVIVWLDRKLAVATIRYRIGALTRRKTAPQVVSDSGGKSMRDGPSTSGLGHADHI